MKFDIMHYQGDFVHIGIKASTILTKNSDDKEFNTLEDILELANDNSIVVIFPKGWEHDNRFSSVFTLIQAKENEIKEDDKNEI